MSGVTVTVQPNGIPIRATYHGGAYIDLAFPSSGKNSPIEVINVWDDEKGESRLNFFPDDDDMDASNRRVLRQAVSDWVEANVVEERDFDPDAKGYEWLDNYIENARYS